MNAGLLSPLATHVLAALAGIAGFQFLNRVAPTAPLPEKPLAALVLPPGDIPGVLPEKVHIGAGGRGKASCRLSAQPMSVSVIGGRIMVYDALGPGGIVQGLNSPRPRGSRIRLLPVDTPLAACLRRPKVTYGIH